MIENKQKIFRRALIACLFLSGLVVMSYLARTKPASIVAAFAGLNPVFILLGVAVVLLAWIVEGIRVYMIADALGEHVPVWRLIRIHIATAFSGNVVPIASMAAPSAQVFLLHREGIPLGKATAIVAARTAASTLFFTATAPLLFIIYGRIFVRGVVTNLALSTVIEIVFIASSAAAITTLIILIKPELGARLTNAAFSLRFIKKLLGSRSEWVSERVARESQAFHESMSILFSSKRDAAFIVLLTLVYWLLYFSVGPLLLLGVGFPLTVAGTVRLVVFLFLTYFLISYLPIPTGSGVSELGFGSILAFFGLPDPIRTVILVVWSFLCVQIYTILGGAFFLGALRKRKRPSAQRKTATTDSVPPPRVDPAPREP